MLQKFLLLSVMDVACVSEHAVTMQPVPSEEKLIWMKEESDVTWKKASEVCKKKPALILSTVEPSADVLVTSTLHMPAEFIWYRPPFGSFQPSLPPIRSFTALRTGLQGLLHRAVTLVFAWTNAGLPGHSPALTMPKMSRRTVTCTIGDRSELKNLAKWFGHLLCQPAPRAPRLPGFGLVGKS